MGKLASFCRLLPLAAAAFASVATSAPPMAWIDVTRITPATDETGVDPTAALEVKASITDGTVADCPAGLGLRTLTGQEIAGTSHRIEVDGDFQYSFTPAAPLGPDSYVLYWVGSPGTDWGIANGEQAQLQSAYADDAWPRVKITQFSTVSDPRVRFGYVNVTDSSVHLSFSEDMDESTLEHVKVLDASGDVLPALAIWHGGELHELELRPRLGAVRVLLEPGLLAATSVDAAPSPITVELQRR